MSNFFTGTMTGLLQAVAIEKGEISVVEIKGMPSKTYRSSECVTSCINSNNEDDTISSNICTTIVI